ncbi:PQQ-binding-like beta-propeller repeat protein [Anaplasma marginale]|uniref:PQQ-binding-like beta-propeller repeat protein n=1 Tax=Anaplasma marginale TaxID=770 RepID=A0A643CLJ5_ANAMA|nr:PQQ-like beta-propeller repeat protein [Anaplasma marginale]KAA8474792.1 PQQ-binding-like beta-propeller repeat protein [Anaplasma marginale]KAB0452362.1 PQQ-binding-like beta-propeller repeat protein [Anaplasma marginale]
MRLLAVVSVFLCLLHSGGAALAGSVKQLAVSERTWGLSTSFIAPEVDQTFSRVRNLVGIHDVVLPPVVVDNRIVVLDGRGRLVALSEEDAGGIAWNVDLAEGTGSVYSGSIVYSDGTLLCAIDNLLYGIDPKDGRIKWKRVLRNPLSGDLVTLNDGKAVAALVIDNCLYVFNVADGGLLWHHEEIGASDIRVKGPLSVAYSHKKHVIVMLLPDGKVLCLDADSGDKVWEIGLGKKDLGVVGRSVVSPVIVAREVLLVNDSGALESVELSSGKKLWSADIEVYDVLGVEKTGIFVLTRDGKLMAFDPESKTQLWILDLDGIKGGGRWNSPVLVGGRLWLLGRNGRLLGVNALSGSVEESYKIPGAFARPFMLSKGMAYASAGKQGLMVLS